MIAIIVAVLKSLTGININIGNTTNNIHITHNRNDSDANEDDS